MIGTEAETAGLAAPIAWFVVETHPRSESIAQIHLERQGFTSFCPRFRKTRRHARRTDEVVVPVFPGYLFVSFDRERDNWTAINGTRGVKRLVGPRSIRPQPMPAQVIDALFARCDGDRIGSLCPTLVKGQRVRVLSGPFANILAEIESLDARGRVRVLLDILGGNASIRIETSQVEPA